MKRVSIYLKLAIVLAVFLLLTYFVEGQGKTDLADKIISVSSFVFGVILAFSIANRHSRLSSIRERLREQDAKLLEIYYLSKIFDKKVQEEIKKRIDSLLISQIDYKLIDFDKEAPGKLKEFFMFIEKLKTSKKEEGTKDKILEILENNIELQKEVVYHVKNKMMAYEWISLVVMVGIIFFSLIFYFNTNNLSSIIVVSLLCTSLTLLLFVLKDLDSLEWQEQNWIWEPLSNLFTELDLLPYFPEAVFDSGRLSKKFLSKWKKVRIAHYPSPYPSMDGKKIEVFAI